MMGRFFLLNGDFSIYDMGANLTGIGVYALQQKYWKDQRITLKVSSIPSKYPNFEVLGTEGGSIHFAGESR